MPRTTAHAANPANKKKRTPRPKKKVVGFIVSDENDDYGFFVKSQDEVAEAVTKIYKKMPSWKRNDGIHDYDFRVRCVAEDGTIKCASLTIEAKVVSTKLTAPAGMTLG